MHRLSENIRLCPIVKTRKMLLFTSFCPTHACTTPESNIRWRWTRKQQNTLDLPLNGTTRIDKLTLPDYLRKAFTRFKHEALAKIQNSPHPHVIPQYGAKTQYAKVGNEFPLLSKEETKYVRAVTGALQSSRYNNPHGAKLDCNWTSKTDKRNNEESEATVRLLCHTKKQ